VTDQYYKQFKLKSEFVFDIDPSLLQFNFWFKKLGSELMLVSDELWSKEPLLQIISKRFPIEVCALSKMNPNTIYDWHTDAERGVGINLKLSIESRSSTLFGQTIDDWNIGFTELDYQPQNFYLFNTSINHSVINFDKDRYLFTVQFSQTDKLVTYNEIYNWCHQEGLFDE